MSDIIKLLPDSVANQIAAGEVIQRPASVVKELVENAVDAGAKSIAVTLKDAGRTLIQVVDDGCGMSETDARMAFERHATSKISAATDLYSLHTMGFRGEALPSIAAVAQVDLRTMPHNAALGTRLLVSGSRFESQEPHACRPGTVMMVKNLFFNIPVRRKFLKKDSVELANVLREFERLALVNPDLELSIAHNDTTLHHLLPATFKRRILDIFGHKLDREIVPVEAVTDIVKIDGYIALPQYARRRGALQYFMVNGRNMRHPYFHRAVMQCYEKLIGPDVQPSYFLRFSVDAEAIDVNIHPTKNEIKFEDEQAIFQILVASVRESLSRFNAGDAIDFDRDDAPDIPSFNPNGAPAPALTIDRTFNPFTQSAPHTHRPAAPTGWENLYSDFEAAKKPAAAAATPRLAELAEFDTTPAKAEIPQPAALLQIADRYIVAPARDGILVIDQNRAHTLVLYREYIKRLASGRIESQQLLFPETVELSPSQSALLKAWGKAVSDLGYDLHPVEDSPGRWEMTAAPATLGNQNPVEPLMTIIDTLADGDAPSAETVADRAARALARSAAIPASQALNAAEREHLLASLLSLEHPTHTPDGLPTMATITTDQIDRLLSRQSNIFD